MEDLIAIRIWGSVRLVLAAALFFVWIPGKILPQEYLADRLDRYMFNCLHMAALATLIFPLFIALRCFGLPFLVLFCVAVKLLFLKFWYRRELIAYLREDIYNAAILGILRALDDLGGFSRHLHQGTRNRLSLLRGALGWRLGAPAGLGGVLAYALYLRLAGTFATLVPAVSDMYQYYYWNQILKLNRLYDRVAGAPYPWGSPVLVYSVNFFSALNTVLLYSTFPLLVLSFSLFSVYYLCVRLFPGEKGSAAPLVAILLFAVVIPSPLALEFFGTVYKTISPQVSHLGPFSFYSGAPVGLDQDLSGYPQLFFMRHSNLLPYELAAAFVPLFLYLLHKALVTRSTLYILLLGESLAVICALHPGVLIALFPSALLIAGWTLFACGMDRKTLARGCASLCGGLLLGNVWLVQMAVYGIPGDVGAAAPILDRLFGTRRMALEKAAAPVYAEVQIVSVSALLLLLAVLSLALLALSLRHRDRQKRALSALVPLFALGILLMYLGPNLGLPRLVDQSRLQTTLALCYGLVAAQCYLLLLEKGILRRLPGRWGPAAARLVAGGAAVSAILLTPRWIDDAEYRRSSRRMELPETPYFVYKIDDTFQPFSYTVVSYLEGFSQVFSRGYHMNVQDLLTGFSPSDRTLKIPTELVFLFVENAPVTFQGGGEYWYRWREDLTSKLKEWIALYAGGHGNLMLWKQTDRLQVYVIDNRNLPEDSSRKWRRLKDPER